MTLSSSCSVPNLTSELFTLQPNFTPIQTTHTVPNNNNAWGGRPANKHTHTHTHTHTRPWYNAAEKDEIVLDVLWQWYFAVSCSWFISLIFHPFACCYGDLWIAGDLLKPAPPPQIHSPGAPLHPGKMLPSDLDSSLANLVGSKSSLYSTHLCFRRRSFFPSQLTVDFSVLLSDLQFAGTPAKKWVSRHQRWSRGCDSAVPSYLFAADFSPVVCFMPDQSSSGVSWWRRSRQEGEVAGSQRRCAPAPTGLMPPIPWHLHPCLSLRWYYYCISFLC